MPNFKWAGNAKAIYERTIEATPRLFRSTTKTGLDKLLVDHYGEGDAITEEMLVHIIKEHTPKAFLGRGMKAIAPLLSDPSLAEY